MAVRKLKREKSDLELRAERINYEGDLTLEIVKRFYDGASIAEKYANGYASLQFHVRSSRPYAFECFSRSTEIAKMGVPSTSVSSEFPVLVWIGNITQGFRPVYSLMRLVRLDSIYVRVRKVSEWPLAFQSTIPMFDEFILGGTDRELRSVRIGQARVEFSQFIDNIVESSAKIMNAVTDDQGELVRSGAIWRKDKVRLIPNLVVLDSNVIRLTRGVGFDLANEVSEMFIGAFNPFTSAVEGMVSHGG